MQHVQKVVEILADRGKRRLPVERLYRHLWREDLLIQAYARIGKNDGATTPGIDSETVDGMNLEKIRLIGQVLQTNDWDWSPVRRVEIPKPKGGTRPLGIPKWSDKLLQQAIRSLLEPYYEPQFSRFSFGFRRGLGCHHALDHIRHHWVGTKWFIEGDIVKCFDQINHSILLDTLREKVHDQRMIKLIRKMLEAGYLEDWSYHPTLSGTPQGGVLSPLLANIYMDRLDQFVEHVLLPRYDRGDRRRENPDYGKLARQVKARDRHKLTVEEAKAVYKQLRTLPSQDMFDPDYRRLRYVRYADDFLLGFIGPKSEAEEIRDLLKDFLASTLKLELSVEKTVHHPCSGRGCRVPGVRTPGGLWGHQTNGELSWHSETQRQRQCCAARPKGHSRKKDPRFLERRQASSPDRTDTSVGLLHRLALSEHSPWSGQFLPDGPERLHTPEPFEEGDGSLPAQDTGPQAQSYRGPDAPEVQDQSANGVRTRQCHPGSGPTRKP